LNNVGTDVCAGGAALGVNGSVVGASRSVAGASRSVAGAGGAAPCAGRFAFGTAGVRWRRHWCASGAGGSAPSGGRVSHGGISSTTQAPPLRGGPANTNFVLR